MIKDFIVFLKEYKIVSLAVALVMGTATTNLVNSLVKDIMLPIAAPLVGAISWQQAVLHIGPVTILYGSFLAELINFLILAFIIFLIVKNLFKNEQGIGKK